MKQNNSQFIWIMLKWSGDILTSYMQTKQPNLDINLKDIELQFNLLAEAKSRSGHKMKNWIKFCFEFL